MNYRTFRQQRQLTSLSLSLPSVPNIYVGVVGNIVYNSAPAPSGYVGWVCITGGTTCSATWIASTAQVLNSYVFAGTKVYKCTVAGTTGTVAPTHSTGSATDGTVTWLYISTLATFKGFGAISA
jgi:hypothetical protein